MFLNYSVLITPSSIITHEIEFRGRSQSFGPRPILPHGLLHLFQAVVKTDCSKRLAFLLYDLELISNQQQLISKTDTYVQSM